MGGAEAPPLRIAIDRSLSAWQAPPEQPLEREGVAQRLEVVALIDHRGGDPIGAVVGGVVAEVVGLPVEHEVAAPVFEHQVDEAAQVAVERAEGQRRHGIAVAAQQGRERAGIQAAGAAWWPLAMARELDDAILSLRTNEADWAKALSEPTAVVFIETPSNPLMEIVDIAMVSKLAHQVGEAGFDHHRVRPEPVLKLAFRQCARLGLGECQQQVEGLHRVLAHTPCRLLAVAVPDLVGDMRAQNQPGTDQEYPNWRVPTCHADGTPLLIEEFTENFAVAERADRLIAAVTHRRHW